MKKRLLALVLCTVFVLSACSPAKDGGEVAGGGDGQGSQILYSNGGPQEFFETPWLNPGSFTYNRVLFDRLIVADENLNAKEGQMAKEYTVSEDGMQIDFTLRDGIKWHDGEPITPEDIKWSIEYSLGAPSLNAVFRATFEAISEITIDGSSFSIKFDKVAPDALLTFTQFTPLPKKYFEGVDASVMQQSKYFQSPVGSGPFKVKEVQMNNYTILEPYAEYWDGVADFDIQLSPSPGDSDPNFVTNAKAGKMDYGYTKSIADVQALTGTAGINIEQVDVRYTRMFYLNKFNDKDGKVSPLADVKVRQALAYALDMPAILEGIFEGAAVPANTCSPDADKPAGLNDYDYNVETAKALLAEANWDPNTEIDLVYYYKDQQTADFLAVIQNQWKDVGVKMNYRLVEGDLGTILWTPPSDPVNGPSAVDWDIAYGAVAALSLHDYYDRYKSGNSINSHTPQDKYIDELIDKTNSTLDEKVVKEAYDELLKYENETLFIFPLYYQPVFVVTSDKIVKGSPVQGNPQFNFNWDIQDWQLK